MSYDPNKGLILISNMPFPMKYIRAESYKVTRSVTDIDSYRDANGVLHRNALNHVLFKVEFETIPLLNNVQVAEIMSFLNSKMTNPKERKLTVTAFLPEIDDYVTQDVYMPDTTFEIYSTYERMLKYNPIRICFIGY